MPLPPAIIIDLDGTLANIDHRRHFVEHQKHKNWKRFFEEMPHDPLNEWCKILMVHFKKDHHIIIASGRPDEYREVTEKWLKQHSVPYDMLLMRAAGDFRPDNVIKDELYEQHISNCFQITFVVDDRRKVVDMWREKGIVCLQCDPGEF